jgi:hypothetical protein
MTSSWAACGKVTAWGGALTRIVRCSMRPCPRAVSVCAGGKRLGTEPVDSGLQAGLVGLHREQILGVLVLDQVAVMVSLGVQRVRGHDRAAQV